MISSTWTATDEGTLRRRWSRWFFVATVPGIWAIANWVRIAVETRPAGPTRGFAIVVFGLGVCATVFALQLADSLAWRLDAARRGAVSTFAATLSLLACASIVLHVLGRL